MFKIYALIDPRTDTPFYIGKTGRDLSIRLKEHITQSTKKDRKYNKAPRFIQDLVTLGLEILIEELQSCTGGNVDFWERHYISLYKSWGFSLTNSTDGGEGGIMDQETRNKISNTLKGRKIPREQVERTRKKLIGVPKIGNYTSEHSKTKVVVNFTMYNSIKEAAQALDIDRNTLTRYAASGEIYTRKNYVVKYKEQIYKSLKESARITGLNPKAVAKYGEILPQEKLKITYLY